MRYGKCQSEIKTDSKRLGKLLQSAYDGVKRQKTQCDKVRPQRGLHRRRFRTE